MDHAVTTDPALDDENRGSGLLIKPAENVEAIFRIRPPFYKKPAEGSDSTRRPALYDKHLAGTLLLRKTVFSPNLPEKLGMVAKDALRKATLPPVGHGLGWISALELEKKARKATKAKAHGEINVGTTYNNIMNYILCVASVLEFPSSSWDTQFLELSMSDSVHVTANSDTGKRKKYAIADAIVMINPDQHDLDLLSQSHIVEDMKITENYFKRIVPFEFKSLCSGSYQTMLGILGHTLSDRFPWEGCDTEDFCAYEHGPKLGRKPVTGDPLGFDAMISGVDLITSNWGGKARGTFQAMSTQDHSKYEAHGRYMLQQIWAEMVKCDSTYAVLHAGNYELLFFRNRRSQTLYISDVIEPHNIGQGTPDGPGYYQIHIGLYIAAVRDAIDRARQLKEFRGDEATLPDTWTRPYDLGFGKYKTGPTPKLPFHNIVCKYMDLCLAPARNESRSINYARNVPYRRSTSPVGAEEKFFFLETRDTSTRELIGYLSVEKHSYRSWPVVIKVANGQKATKQLYQEYRNHLDLAARRGQDVMVQKAYGLFTMEVGKRSILLLEYVGKAVPAERLKCLTPHQQMALRQTLSLIHDKRMVHGALSRRNICMDDGPKCQKRHPRNAQLLWLTDLGHIRREEIENEIRYERKRLKRWFKRNENVNSHKLPPPPSHPIELGPVPFEVEDAKAAFDRLTSWMSQEPWLQTADCSIKKDVLSDGAWLVVKFSFSEDVMQFIQEWDHRPPDFLETTCENTSFNLESRGSSQALSPPSGLDSEESSQANSAMMVIG